MKHLCRVLNWNNLQQCSFFFYPSIRSYAVRTRKVMHHPTSAPRQRWTLAVATRRPTNQRWHWHNSTVRHRLYQPNTQVSSHIPLFPPSSFNWKACLGFTIIIKRQMGRWVVFIKIQTKCRIHLPTKGWIPLFRLPKRMSLSCGSFFFIIIFKSAINCSLALLLHSYDFCSTGNIFLRLYVIITIVEMSPREETEIITLKKKKTCSWCHFR